MSETAPDACLYFQLGASSPTYYLNYDSTRSLAELAAEISTSPLSRLRAYEIPTDTDLSSLDWPDWDETVARLVPLDLETQADAVGGRVLLVDCVRSPAASVSSSEPSEPVRSSWATLPPSESAKYELYIQRQRANDETTIYNGQPAERTGPSVCCYVPAFCDFKVAVRQTEPDVDVPNDDNRIVHALKLMDAACDFYDSETIRQKTLAKYLGSLCPAVMWKEVKHSDWDGRLDFLPDASSCVQPFDPELCELALLLGEMKIEDSNPELRVACDYEMYCRWKTTAKWRERSCVPCLLFAMIDTHIVINGAIYLGGPVVQQLYRTDLRALYHGPDPIANAKRLVHVFASLSKAVAALQEFYRTLPMDSIPPFVPPTYTIANWNVSWTGSPVPPLPRTGRMVFYADVKSSTYAGLAVVKFARTYSEDAHRTMEALGAAAPLLYYEYDKLIGRHVVITKRLEEARMPLDEPELQRLGNALKAYHAAGFVFGDLRLSNIVRDGHGLKLIDFDGAGRKDKAHYPKINQAVKRARGVRSYEPIQPEHDMAMLAKVRFLSLHARRSVHLCPPSS